MLNVLKESLWKQFVASIDMLKNAILLCPEEYWKTNEKLFYNAYHCLIFLDYYLTIPNQTFTSPLPFSIAVPENVPEDAIDDLIPDRKYSKKELLDYLQSSRDKCYQLIAGLTAEKLNERWIEEERHMPHN
jgi:predicted ATP-dependent Lon-type protease